MFLIPVNRPYPGKNNRKLTIFTLARFSEKILKSEIKDLEEANAYIILQAAGR